MRPYVCGRAIAAIALALACTACAKTMGQAAGTIVGGGAYALMKGSTFAVKTTGRTMVGAAKGVHDEFSKKEPQKVASNSKS